MRQSLAFKNNFLGAAMSQSTHKHVFVTKAMALLLISPLLSAYAPTLAAKRLATPAGWQIWSCGMTFPMRVTWENCSSLASMTRAALFCIRTHAHLHRPARVPAMTISFQVGVWAFNSIKRAAIHGDWSGRKNWAATQDSPHRAWTPMAAATVRGSG